MTPLERDLLLKAIQNNPDFMSSFAKGKALGGFTKQTLSGIGNMADDANKIIGVDDLIKSGYKVLPKGARVGANAVVTKDVASFDTVMGSPAKSVKKYNKITNKKFTAYGTPTDIDYDTNK